MGKKGSAAGRRITEAFNEHLNPTLDSGTWQDQNSAAPSSVGQSSSDVGFVSAPYERSISSPGRFSFSTGGAFGPVSRSVVSGSLRNVFNPRGNTGSDFVGGESGPSMMESANQFADRTYVAPTSAAAAEYFSPTAEQDAMYRNMYNTTGYIPEGGYSTVYQDPNTLEAIRYGERSHQVPMSWNAPSYPNMTVTEASRQQLEMAGLLGAPSRKPALSWRNSSP